MHSKEGTGAKTAPLRIALCPPEFEQFQRAMCNQSADATHIIQRYIATGLQDDGHQLTFLAPLDFGRTICTTDVKRADVGRQTWSASGWFRVASKGTWRIQKALGVPYLNVFSNYCLYDTSLQCLPGHDVVYERNTLYRNGIARACRRLGIPYVLYIEADDILEHDIMGKPITGLLRRRARETAKYNLDAADCVITVSEPTRAHLASVWGIPTEKILVFPNAVDVRRFQPSASVRSEVRSTLGLGDGPVIMFLGNFYEWHDVPTLLKAFAEIVKRNSDVRLVLVGDGDRRKAMMQYASELGVDDTVHFTGLVAHAEVPRMLNAADIAVVPYPVMEREMWLSPLKMYEYMAAGLAIVASSVGQITEVIHDRRNGLLVPPEDVTAMAAALQALLDDDAFRAQLAKQAREDAVNKHSWGGYLARLERVLGAVVDGRSPAGF